MAGMLGLTVLMLLEPAGFVLGSVTEAPSATPAGLWWKKAEEGEEVTEEAGIRYRCVDPRFHIPAT